MAASGLARTAAPSKADPYVAKFTGKKIRTFKFNYARIFGLKESGFVTIDPGTFEVTNTFDYADVTNLKMGKDALRFEFKSKQHGAMEFESTFRVNVTALLILAQETCPDMIEMGDCALLVTGNTGAWRGKPHFTGFAPSKSAQRILAEALARDLGPQGVHVAYITIDAAIDIWWVRERRGLDYPQDMFAKPADIAGECFHVAHQPKSTWSFNVELRPYNEPW